MSAHATSEIDALSTVFSALSDPTRRAMLTRLSLGEASVNELAAPFSMSLPAVSKHIKVLEKAGLLTKTIHAQQRSCKIDGAHLKQAVDWIAQYKQLWEGRLDRLDAYLLNLQADERLQTANPIPTDPKLTDPVTAHLIPNNPIPTNPITNQPRKENKHASKLQPQARFNF
jgi:DNA-binding transcriptional ArsR family regulator